MIPLRADRVRLRPFVDTDAEALLAIHQHEGLRRFVPSAVLDDLDAVPERFARYHRYDEHPVHGMVAVERIANGTVVGMILVKPIPASEGVVLDDVEIGWRGHPDHGGQGYVAEAAQAALDHALISGLPRIVAVTDPANTASQSVALRIGMADRGTTDDYYDERGTRLFVADAPHLELLDQQDEGSSRAFVIHDADGPVGQVTVGPVVDGDALVSYRVEEPVRGRRLATRAVGIVANHLRAEGVRRLVAEAAVDNVASRRVLERTGFSVVETDGPIYVGDDEPAVRHVRVLS